MTIIIRVTLLITSVGLPLAILGARMPDDPNMTASRSGRLATITRTPQPTVTDPGSALAEAQTTAPPTPSPDVTPEPVMTRAATPKTPAPPAPVKTRPPPVVRPSTAPRPPSPTVAKPSTPRPTPVPNADYDREEVKRQIRATWPENDDEAIVVVGCETAGSYNPRTYNAAGPYYGLWQFTQGTWEAYGGSGDPRDASPTRQTEVAWRLYAERGWAAWPGCAPDR